MTKPNPLTSNEIREDGSRLCLTYPTEPRAQEARGKTPVSKTGNCFGVSQNEGITKAPSARRAEARADIDREFVRKKNDGAKGTSHKRIQDEIQGDFTHTKQTKDTPKRHHTM